MRQLMSSGNNNVARDVATFSRLFSYSHELNSFDPLGFCYILVLLNPFYNRTIGLASAKLTQLPIVSYTNACLTLPASLFPNALLTLRLSAVYCFNWISIDRKTNDIILLLNEISVHSLSFLLCINCYCYGCSTPFAMLLLYYKHVDVSI